MKNDRIVKIGNSIKFSGESKVIDASGKIIFPGLIDDQVHFREPGLTNKATIKSESKAALAGGITSFLEMPNTNPQTITIADWEEKNKLASKTSFATTPFLDKSPDTEILVTIPVVPVVPIPVFNCKNDVLNPI